jgi:hypothetical protein
MAPGGPGNAKRREPWGSRRLRKLDSSEHMPRTPSLELSVLPTGGGLQLCRTDQRKIFPTEDGAEGDRTPDLCSAIAALSQLSYSPAGRPSGEGANTES